MPPNSSPLADRLESAVPKCPHCAGAVPCKACEVAKRPGVKQTENGLEVTLPVGADQGRIGEMLRARNLEPDEWIVDRLKVNDWEGFFVSKETDAEVVVPLHQTTAFLNWIRPPELTEWGQFTAALSDVFQTAPAVPRRRLKPTPSPSLWFVAGDDQAPFVNWPLHELTLEALRDISPDKAFYTGDGLDLPDISTHRSKEGTVFHARIVECLDTAYRVLSERTEAAGGFSEAYYAIGNHEYRIDKFLKDKAPQLFGIRKSRTETDLDPEPLLSVRHLLRLDDLGYTVCEDERGDYPYGSVRIADELIGSHGWIARKGAGSSAIASIEHLNSGIVVGHTHRAAIAHLTRWTPDGEPIVYTAAEAGTMADPRGLGYAREPDWQSGFLTVSVDEDGGHHLDLALYRNGVLRWRDRSWTLTPRGVRAR